ncbi:MAG: lipoprotein-releasing ABC transporter permease subunit [Alphaproteobacteria bacterium]|nr:lipoprotein-releasing ABC transporter permease subunit [Alphaproteobacteria bacterium]
MLFTKLEKKIAFRYLRAKRKEGFISVISWVSLLGIMLGVATLIVVMSVMAGFHDALLSRIVGMNGHVVVYHQDGAIEDYDFLIDKIKQNKIVSSSMIGVIPVLEGQAMASANGVNSGAMVRGIRMDDLSRVTGVGTKIFGTALRDVGDGQLVMGAVLSRRLRLTMDDTVTLIAANSGTPTAFGTIPRMMSYPVKSTFMMGMYEYDSGYVFMNLETAQKYMNSPGGVSHIDLFLRDPGRTDAVRDVLRGFLPHGFVVRDWRELNKGFVGALQVERNVMFLILMLIIIVAAFNIVSSLVMIVKDKSRDIAVLRTFGVSRKSMMKIFMLNGVCIGVIGSVFGTVLGLVLAKYVEQIRQFFQWFTGRDLFPPEMYFLSELPSKIDPVNVAGIAIVAVLLSFLATLYPAWKAAKMDPVEVLRYE